MNTEMNQTVTTKYEVTFGPKKENDREKKEFSNEDDAVKFFKEKDKAGMHVNVYEIQITVVKKQLA